MAQVSTRLWEKGISLDEAIHRFTVGDDPVWDRQLVHWDCLGSAAHAKTLHRAGLLCDEELTVLLAALTACDLEAQQGAFEIPTELEDCHTALEAALIDVCGEAGEKIHTGRSRNDQVATAMRLYMRHQTLVCLGLLSCFAYAAIQRARRDGHIAMPGYTHMELAMPSSVGQWLHAIVEATLEQMRAAFDLLKRLDACPLGTGAGFGVPLPLDREYTAELLGFSHAQRSPIDVQNSRGRMERYFVRGAVDVGSVLEKMSCDVLLYSSAAYGFFSLPESMTTGSSIMPQKKNPDVLELMRAHGARLRSRLTEIEWASSKLPSGYQRDLQLTKEPVVRATGEVVDMLVIATRVIAGFEIHADRMAAAMKPEIFATHAALDLVQQGLPFRQAYRKIAEEINAGQFEFDAAAVLEAGAGRVSDATWKATTDELHELSQRTAVVQQQIDEAEAALLHVVG